MLVEPEPHLINDPVLFAGTVLVGRSRQEMYATRSMAASNCKSFSLRRSGDRR